MSAYIIARVAVDNPELLKDYQAVTPRIIEKYRGKFVARGGSTVTLEGPCESRRIVIIEFPELSDAEAFYNSPEYSQARKLREGVAVAESSLAFIRENKTFASSEGSYIQQEIVESGLGLVAVAVAEGEMQKRSYPNSFGRHQGTAGWEFIQAWDLTGNARRMGEEAVALLSAPQCPSGVITLILDGPQLALQVHESCGHPIELYRVFGTEAAFAGTSFLTPDKYGTLRYGSEIVNLTADAVTPTGLGTFGYDDEGVPAQRTDIVKNGTFVGYLTSRETATQLRRIRPDAPARSNGTMRADGWNRVPIIRMTNVSLQPGEWTLDDLIADTELTEIPDGRSLVPVFDQDLDHLVGYLALRDLLPYKYGLKSGIRLVEIVKFAISVPSTKNCADLLVEMRESNSEMAVVIDEYGGTAGIVTFRALVEQLLGYFYPSAEKDFEELAPDRYKISGHFKIEELAELLEQEIASDSRTVAGLIIERLGEIPAVGTKLVVDLLEFTVVKISKNRILELEARKLNP